MSQRYFSSTPGIVSRQIQQQQQYHHQQHYNRRPFRDRYPAGTAGSSPPNMPFHFDYPYGYEYYLAYHAFRPGVVAAVGCAPEGLEVRMIHHWGTNDQRRPAWAREQIGDELWPVTVPWHRVCWVDTPDPARERFVLVHIDLNPTFEEHFGVPMPVPSLPRSLTTRCNPRDDDSIIALHRQCHGSVSGRLANVSPSTDLFLCFESARMARAFAGEVQDRIDTRTPALFLARHIIVGMEQNARPPRYIPKELPLMSGLPVYHCKWFPLNRWCHPDDTREYSLYERDLHFVGYHHSGSGAVAGLSCVREGLRVGMIDGGCGRHELTVEERRPYHYPEIGQLLTLPWPAITGVYYRFRDYPYSCSGHYALVHIESSRLGLRLERLGWKGSIASLVSRCPDESRGQCPWYRPANPSTTTNYDLFLWFEEPDTAEAFAKVAMRFVNRFRRTGGDGDDV